MSLVLTEMLTSVAFSISRYASFADRGYTGAVYIVL